ncbi:HTH domain-containing protein [Devosia sp. 63-57]|uniref:HTH domain-containing protein n=1 Tax=Devosia sp. 63-57 TaxID=1895751 RepID=UPI00338FE3D3
MTSALEIIKSRGPISAAQLAEALALDVKAARSAIDRLRRQGEPIWLDRQRGFWWADDLRPSGIAHEQWKRDFVASL